MGESRVLTRERVDEIVSSILKDESIKDEVIEIGHGSAKGDGYLSFVTKVDIKGNKDLHLMIKAAPKMEELRKVFPIRDVFLREIYFYETVVKEFNKFEEERGIFEPSINAPKCFKTSAEDEKELLVFENIKELGFRMWNRKIQMNEEHISLVFKQYGKYHAVSYAMRDQNPELYECLIEKLGPIFNADTFSSEMSNKFIEITREACSCFDPVDDKEIHDTLEKYIDGISDFFVFLQKELSKNSVIIHGDCWCNNMMFKYDDDSKPTRPTEVCMLDFQLVLHSSPVLDLSYFFLVSASETILSNYKQHLKDYHESLKNHYEKLGGNPDNLISFDELLHEWKIYAKYGFTMALTVFKAMLTEEDEAVDLNDVKDNKLGIFDLFSKKMKNDDIYKKMIKILAKYMFANDLFSH